MRKMSIPSAPATFKRSYNGLAGVDFSSQASKVEPFRSPDALNVYKDYFTDEGQAVETRPGFSVIGTPGAKIYGIHMYNDYCLVHYGTHLALAVGFPTITSYTELNSAMNEAYSSSFMFDGKLYILDGLNYLVYNGSAVSAVSANAYIPTTRIGADPNGNGGSAYQDVNYLSAYRKNSFVADGTSTVYYLDATETDNETPTVWHDGTEVSSGFTLNASAGTVTFTTAPTAPATIGTDNVIIQFKKTVTNYAAHVTKCTIAKVFDNRVFLTGNNDYKGVLFHSELKDPSYFSDDNWSDDGDDNVPIKALIQGNGVLVAVKEDNGDNNPKVYYHSPQTDTELGRVYPSYTTNIARGAICDGANFESDVVYVSRQGMEQFYMTSDTLYARHKSSLVDTKLINEENFTDIKIEVWRNYLVCLINGKIYLADWRQQRYKGITGYEYEWYLWDGIGVIDNSVMKNACIVKSYNNALYFGTVNGSICVFGGKNDEDRAINAYWTTPLDMFSEPAHLKTISKRGGVAEIKAVQNCRILIDIITDKESRTNVYDRTTAGFDFGNIDFGDFDFGSDPKGVIFYKINRKKVWYFQMVFYCNEKDRYFGLYSAALEAQLGNYKKEAN